MGNASKISHEEGKNLLMRQFVSICNNHLATAGQDPEQALATVVQVLAALADVQGSMVAKLPDVAQRKQALENLTERMAMVVALATAQEKIVPAAMQTVDVAAVPVAAPKPVPAATAPKIALVPTQAVKPALTLVPAQVKQDNKGHLPSIDD